jgi:dTDP-4-dehydrorhamnose reductase
MKRIIIFGASGQLGTELSSILSNKYEVIKVYNSKEIEDGYKIDIRDIKKVRDFILKKQPEIVINAAAMTDVDKCEVEKENAYRINSEAVRYMVQACRILESYFVQISTDYVFDGKKGMYKEDDIPNPTNYYGLTKLLGDIYVLSYEDSLVVRTSGIFRNKGFPVYAYKTLKNGGTVFAFKGFYSPISAKKLAMAINEILDYRTTGILNIAGERISRYELALKIKEEFNLSGNIIEVDEIKEWIAKRPFDSSLDISKAKKILSTEFYKLDLNDIVIE